MRPAPLFGKLTQLRHLPFNLWRLFVSGWLDRRKNGVVPCILAGGERLVYVPLKEFYETYWYFCEHPRGRHELAFFVRKLKSREIFYDIGAFRGAYSAAAKSKLHKKISVHVFEPLAKNVEAVQRIRELNAFDDFKINPLAVNDGSSLSGSVNEQDDMLRLGDKGATTAVKFPSVSLDGYIAEGNPPPTVVKLDVEGFELQVLRGARNCLVKNRPQLWIEVHPRLLETQGISPDTILDLLRKTGYTISFFDDFNPEDPKSEYHIWCE